MGREIRGKIESMRDIAICATVTCQSDDFEIPNHVDVTSMNVHQTERHAERYPKGRYVDELWTRLSLGGRIKVRPDELNAAIGAVNQFCRWLEEIRNDYPRYVQALVDQETQRTIPSVKHSIIQDRKGWRRRFNSGRDSSE